jgi:glycosyltransferase involved in cell wall biosynthesis
MCEAGAVRAVNTVKPTVVVVLKGYPRLSESFIAQELHGLEQRGLALHLVSLRHPTDKLRHPVHELIQAPVTYLPEYLHHEPARVLAGWRGARQLPGFARARAIWLRDLGRDRSANRMRRFGQAMVLAHELGPRIAHLHAHFLHTPASVTRYAAMMLGLDWTFSAHARDIWTSPEWELREKLGDCCWGVTCTAVNDAHLNELSGTQRCVELVYHGLDLTRFDIVTKQWSESDGTDVTAPVKLLSVGRAVAKKGYDDLLHALASVPDELNWQFTHIGGGPLLGELQSLAERLGLAPRICWLGALAQTEVLEQYRASDVFMLASKIAEDGDRDGLPNVLVEAQSQGLAAIATSVSAIPELIEHDRNGLLAEAGDRAGLGAAIERCIREPNTRQRLGEAGQALVQREYSMNRGLDRLLAKFAGCRGVQRAHPEHVERWRENDPAAIAGPA